MRSLARRLGTDGVAALILIALSILGFIEASSYPERAGIWPKWMLGLLLLLSLILLIQSLMRGKRGEP